MLLNKDLVEAYGPIPEGVDPAEHRAAVLRVVSEYIIHSGGYSYDGLDAAEVPEEYRCKATTEYREGEEHQCILPDDHYSLHRNPAVGSWNF